MSLQLDQRRRAMLAQMGIRVDEPYRAAEVATPSPRPSARRADGNPAPAGPPPRAVEAVARERPGPAALEPRPAGVELMSWDELAQAVAGCRACKLCAGRRNTVFGVGDAQADWLIVGEAPGENEDLQGEPFVGPAGQLLDNMLKALGLDRRHKVYIANVLKCRPPGNRNPQPEEVAQCEPFLRRQVQLLQPRIILAMGRFAVQSLLDTTEPIGKLRGRAYQYLGVPVVVTYHPAYLLRNLPDKAKAWADLCLAQALVRDQQA
jgi:DNA polymerase